MDDLRRPLSVVVICGYICNAEQRYHDHFLVIFVFSSQLLNCCVRWGAGTIIIFPVIINMTGIIFLTLAMEKRQTMRITGKRKQTWSTSQNPHALWAYFSIKILLFYYCNFEDLLFQACDCLLNRYSHSAASRLSKHHYTSVEYELWAFAVPLICFFPTNSPVTKQN